MAASVLIVGESWMIHTVDIKGFISYTSSRHETAEGFMSDALQAGGNEVTYLSNVDAGEQFPRSLEQMRRFDAIVFSDVASDTLLLTPETWQKCTPRPNPLKLVREFVAEGGGFAMIGGHVSFQGYAGLANYRGTPIEEILPVSMLPGDDRVEAPEGVRPETCGCGDHPVIAGIRPPWPTFLGYNRLVAKDGGGAMVLLKCGSDPFLVVGEYGKGRTLAFASDCSQHWATPEALHWEGYGAFLRQAVGWLKGRA